ncbi:MAG TPA: hypothetical protein VIL49_03220 [Capillimicrobium sp.]|jgi:hypothetical protein
MLAGLLAAALALVALLALAAVPPSASSAPARAYPPGVKPAFMKTCVPTARSSSGGQFNRSQAKTYCRVSYNCLSKRLTFEQFKKLSSAKGRTARIAKKCTERGAAAALG